jgi:hypothetical protein
MSTMQQLTPSEEQQQESCYLMQAFVDANWSLAWTSLPSIAIMGWLLTPPTALPRLWAWLALMYVQSAHMMCAMATFRRHPVAPANNQWRHRYLILTGVFAGLCWGSSATFLWPSLSVDQHTVLLLFMAGVCAIAGVCNASLLSAGAPFQVCAWLPIIAQLLDDSAGISPRVLFMIVLFVVIMVVAMMQGAVMHRKMVRMTMDNRRLLVEVSQARHTAEAANAAKDRFLAAVSHDLRQPAYALSLLLRTASSHALPGTVAGLIDNARAALGNMRGMLDALLDLTRAQSGDIVVQREAVPLMEVFAAVRSTMAGYADARGLDLSFRATTLVVDTDSTAIARILSNLVENAIRHTERGRILVTARARGARVLVQVWDNGAGIAPAECERIFESFVQLNNPQRDWRRGLGLGLAIVRNLADSLGHELALHSRLGAGSVFSIALPRRAEGVQQQDRPRRMPAPGPARRVLVMEDDRDVSQALVQWLERQGYHIATASDADEALALPGFSALDAAVIDYRLADDRNGAGELERMRAALGRALPALIVSGDTHGPHLEILRAAGLPLMFKPLDPDTLVDALQRLLTET